MSELVKINYVVEGYTKFVSGTLIKEDETFFYVLTKDGKTFTINKLAVTEMRRWDNQEGRQ